MLRVAAIFTLCEKLWTLRLPKHMGKDTPVFLWRNARVALKIGVNPSLSILKYVSETAPGITTVPTLGRTGVYTGML